MIPAAWYKHRKLNVQYKQWQIKYRNPAMLVQYKTVQRVKHVKLNLVWDLTEWMTDLFISLVISSFNFVKIFLINCPMSLHQIKPLLPVHFISKTNVKMLNLCFDALKTIRKKWCGIETYRKADCRKRCYCHATLYLRLVAEER